MMIFTDSDPWGDVELSDPPVGDDDDPPVTPWTPLTLQTGDSCSTTQTFKPNMTPPIQPALKKRYGKQKDNGIGNQVKNQEVGDEMRLRATKRSKPTIPVPQAKPKSKSKPKLVCLYTCMSGTVKTDSILLQRRP
jgi:hypothetical protein